MRKLLAIALAAAAVPVSAQQVGNQDSTFEAGILVTSADVLTCPYVLIKPVEVASTEGYGKAAARVRSFGKLRDEARKLGADAVVLVKQGGAHMTLWAWRRREMTGNAIRNGDKSCTPTL